MAEQSGVATAQQGAVSSAVPVPVAAPKAKNTKKIQQKPISKKRKFIKDGVFYAEINDYFKRELSENGYAGCEVRVTPTRTEIIIRATKVNDVVGKNGQKIRELTALVQKKFNFPKKGVILFCEKVRNQGLSALAQSEAVKFRLLQGLSVRRAAYSVVKFIMDKGADGCEVTISGKIRGQRAKSMKFRDGYMIHAGNPVNYYIDHATKHVHLRQGVIGIRVKIMLPHTETDRNGRQIIIVPRELPDKVHVKEPKDIDFDEDAKNQEQLQRGLQQNFTTQHTSSYGAALTEARFQNAQDNSGGATRYPQQQQQQPNVNNENQGFAQQNVGQNNDYNQQYDQQFEDYNDNTNQQNNYYQQQQQQDY